MNNKLPIIISIFVLLAIIFLSFSNTGQFIGTVGPNEEAYELTDVSDYDNDGVADIIECPALEAFLAYDNPSEEDNSDIDDYQVPDRVGDLIGGGGTGGRFGGFTGLAQGVDQAPPQIDPTCENPFIKVWNNNLGQIVDVADINCNGVIVLDSNFQTTGSDYLESERPFFACDVNIFDKPFLDTDCDGTTDLAEKNQGTDPYMPTDMNDFDGDGISNNNEYKYECLDVYVKDNKEDSDNDGLTNEEEIKIYSNPCIADSDGDGDLDGDEVAFGSSPTDNSETIDSDGDGLSDKSEEQYGTDPNNPDTDGDTYSDGLEVELMNGGRDDVDPFDVNKPGVLFDRVDCPDSTGDGPDWQNPAFPSQNSEITWVAYCKNENYSPDSSLDEYKPVYVSNEEGIEYFIYNFNVGENEYELQFTPISMEFGSNNDLIEAEIQIDFSEGWTERLIFSSAPSSRNQNYGPEEFPMIINLYKIAGFPNNEGKLWFTVGLITDSQDSVDEIEEIYQCSNDIQFSEPVTEEETDNTGGTARSAGYAFADLDYLGNNNICKGSFTPDTQQTTDHNSIVLITQITDKDTNEVEDYTYSIINSPEVKLYEAYLTFDSANEDCEVFVWEDFSGKPISYAKYQPPEMSQPGSGDSNDPIPLPDDESDGTGGGYTGDDLVGGSGGIVIGGGGSSYFG